jgi:phosphoribosyl-ATP pyrophosphohydrolase
MGWTDTVAQKRATRDKIIEETSEFLTKYSAQKDWNALVPEHASISYLLEQLCTARISAETLVAVTIDR